MEREYQDNRGLCDAVGWKKKSRSTQTTAATEDASLNVAVDLLDAMEQVDCDVGYPHKRGYMAPYKGGRIRFHIHDFRRANGIARALEMQKKILIICILHVEWLSSEHLEFGKFGLLF